MNKTAYFFVDDVIWVMRDIARKRPKSLFDNAYLACMKKAHDEYGMTVQLNLFYRTDFFYGNDEFTLAEMPADYKAEWEAASDWLKLAFHSKQEWPDYPLVNATYDDVKDVCEMVKKEIFRFAGEKSWSNTICMHWGSVSRAGVKALYDCGIRIITPTVGVKTEWNGDASALPYGHSFRILHNRQPETGLYTRKSKNKAILSSICGYNHISDEQFEQIFGTNLSVLDEESGMQYRILGRGPCLNLNKLEELESGFSKLIGNEYIGYATHEQYFYSDYFAYQPDYADKVLEAARILHENGYTYVTCDQIVPATKPI